MAEDETPDTPPESPPAEDKSSAQKQSLVSEAKIQADRLEKANAKHEILLNRADEQKAETVLSGKSDAGQAPPPVVEESAEEYAKKVMAGEIE